jgi:hypothetical protein
MKVRYIVTDPEKNEHIAASTEEYYAMINCLQAQFGWSCDLLIRAEFLETVDFLRKETDASEAA